MSTKDTIQEYNNQAEKLAAEYERLRFEQVHADILDFMPRTGGFILDVGAGSGRDAAWFAASGCDVVAVEPASRMLERARELHKDARIRWVQDKLPGLENVFRLSLSFDFILVSAVWMHIPPEDRQRAFRKLVSLLKPGGRMVISLRHGPLDEKREAHPVSVTELERLAREYAIAITRVCQSPDRMQRANVSWETVSFQLPDDGTEALPIIRQIILNDEKQSTYKLALVRVLVRIADSAAGAAKIVDDDFISIPLGLVALYWVRMYKPLIERGIAQKPASKDQKGLAFVREAFESVLTLSHYDLRVGARFSGATMESLRAALIDARNTIHKMPAYFITYPNSSEQIFKTQLTGRVLRSNNAIFDEKFFWSFGDLQVPRHIWTAMARYASWIEPALLAEWIRLMQTYEGSHGRSASYDSLMNALEWLEPERDTRIARSIMQTLINAQKPVYCVWSGKKLRLENSDIDHCFPYSAWPCGDLWNLLPTDRTINQRAKGDRLITARTLESARERTIDWWNNAYLETETEYLKQRFLCETAASLPGIDRSDGAGDEIFEGLQLKRAALKQDLQLRDWEYGG